MPLLFARVLPLAFWYVLLVVLAIAFDLFLHRLDLFWIGRYLGIAGTLLILLSFAYSLRKRKSSASVRPKSSSTSTST
jgi:hypothetical protein